MNLENRINKVLNSNLNINYTCTKCAKKCAHKQLVAIETTNGNVSPGSTFDKQAGNGLSTSSFVVETYCCVQIVCWWRQCLVVVVVLLLLF